MSHTSLNEYFVLGCLGIILAVPFFFRLWLNRYPVRNLQSVDSATGKMSTLIFIALFVGGFVFEESSRRAGKVLLLASIFSFYVLYQSRARYLLKQNSVEMPARNTPVDRRINLGKLAVAAIFFASLMVLTRAPYLSPLLLLGYPFVMPYFVRLQYPSNVMAKSPLRAEIEAIFKKAKVSLSEIYIIDSNRKSSDAMMANSTLFITVDLFLKLNEEEIQAVVAHEASHLQHKHLWKRLFTYTAYFMLAVFWVIFPATFAFMQSPGVIFLTIPIVSILQFYMMKKSMQRQEMEADLGAIALGASSNALISALHHLSAKDVAPKNRFFGGFHPTVTEREKIIREGAIPKNAYFQRKKYAYAYSLLVLGYVFHVAQTKQLAVNRTVASSQTKPANIAHLEAADADRKDP